MTWGGHAIRSMTSGKSPLDRHPGPSLLLPFLSLLPWMPVFFDLGNEIGFCFLAECLSSASSVFLRCLLLSDVFYLARPLSCVFYCCVYVWQSVRVCSCACFFLCFSCDCHRFRCPLLHVFCFLVSLFVAFFKLYRCASVIAVFFFLFLCPFFLFLFLCLFCVFFFSHPVPFWTS